MNIFGFLFIISTTLILLLKQEKNNNFSESHQDEMGILTTYKSLIKIVQLPAVQKFTIIILTSKVFIYFLNNSIGHG
jgi:hypothetical protein